MRTFALIALAGTLALAACGKKEEQAPTNNLVEPPVENVIVNEPEAEVPAPEPSNNAVPPPPAPPPSISEQQQIEDDAAATGMTSRLSRDEVDQSGNSTQ
ncbi:hypothetical protein [Sphingobium estronivorans]|uniref:hypothetical protein n=1 Tax=Sphingobium estronivorans TaxID=1577690 RepID=UPI001239E2E3|nr:hypothetical protein [Sphingobium estronivorans]